MNRGRGREGRRKGWNADGRKGRREKMKEKVGNTRGKEGKGGKNENGGVKIKVEGNGRKRQS